jgi:hypothetical protein
MDVLSPVIMFFAGHPLVAFVMSLAFIVPCFYPVYSGRQKSLLLPCSIVWLGFGLWSFYMLGKNVNIGDSINPVLFSTLLTIASFGLTIVIKGILQKPIVDCSSD